MKRSSIDALAHLAPGGSQPAQPEARPSQPPAGVSRLVGRVRQLHRIWRSEGGHGVSRRARAAVADLLAPTGERMPVAAADVIAADLTQAFRPAPRRREAGAPWVINWVAGPTGAGSGGHTTIYRIANYLQERGFINRVYFYDVHNVDLDAYAAVLRNSYGFKGEIFNVRNGMADADAVFATSWPTAYAVFNSRCAGKRFYFVQDYEPDFYPAGSLSELARNTYQMGFHGITAGPWLAERLELEFGMQADHFDFGCDAEQYAILPGGVRDGISFYARPEVQRRGFELGIMALERFSKRRPDLKIHLYGQSIERLPFAFVNHGRVNPAALNAVYNRCFAGLSLSLTNTSLVPHEMLAAGCIPVVNDARYNRLVLDNPFVRYASTAPAALSDALEAVAGMPDFAACAAAAARSVQGLHWDKGGEVVERILLEQFAAKAGSAAGHSALHAQQETFT
ncbi:MAG: group 1 glycosyl transferase [Rhizobacter sp.]|nr:group 1 glycosyl transferase [Rhizobacter sp.]